MEDYLSVNCDYRQLPQYNQYLVGNGWEVECLGFSTLLRRRFTILGTVLILKRGDPQTPVAAIEELVDRYRVSLVKLDFDVDRQSPPAAVLQKNLVEKGYCLSHLPFCPTKTIKIDLSPDPEKILAQTSGDVRRYLRKNEKENFIIRRNRKIDDFYPILKKASKIRSYFIPSLSNLKKQWEVFGTSLKTLVGYKDGEVIGGAMVLCQNEQAAGIYMAFNDEGLRTHLPYSMMWEAITVSKDSGCRVLDLDGIYDERFDAPRAWKGLSVFKKKFGGREVEYPGTYVKCRYFSTRILTALRLL